MSMVLVGVAAWFGASFMFAAAWAIVRPRLARAVEPPTERATGARRAIAA